MAVKRTKIDDIARLTGLSRSTVDRVINARAGVREDTKSRVEQALRTLGYAPSAMMSRQLHPDTSLSLVLSEGTNPFFSEIWKGMKAATDPLSAGGVPVTYSGFDPYRVETLAMQLRQVPDNVTSLIVVGADNLEVETAINELVARGVRVVTIVSDVPKSKRHAYVGQDNFAAGQTAGRLMIEAFHEKTGEIAILLGHLQFRHLLDRQSGFQQVIGLERPDISLLALKPYGASRSTARDIVDQLGQVQNRLAGIYVAGGGQPYLMEALARFNNPKPVIIGHEATVVNRTLLGSRVLNFIVSHDVYEIGRKALELVLSEDSGKEHQCAIAVHVFENFPTS